MQLITLEQARTHVRADGDDDTQLTVYCNAAESACARLANRSLFATAADRDAAVANIPTAMVAAYAAYDAAVIDANDQDDDRVKSIMLGSAQARLNAATLAADSVAHGLSLEDPDCSDIVSAVLLTVGHLYRNRENVVAGQSVVAVEVPMNAQNIMDLHRWIGLL